MQPAPLAPRRYEGLDVLRGIAALWVLLSHYLPFWSRHFGPAPILVPNDWGVYAVQLFFVISGFVIFTTLEKCQTVGDFVILRFSRLYPVYWATLALVTLISFAAFGRSPWIGGLVVNATMLQDFVGYARFDNVFWSLSAELVFYVLAAVAFVLRIHRRPLLPVALWLAAAFAWGLWSAARNPDARDGLALAFALDYAPYFAIGIAFYQAVRHGWTASVVATLGLALVVEALIAGRPGIATGAICVALFALGLYGGLRLLTGRLTLWLGHISFALYLVHRNLGYELLSLLHKAGFGPIEGVLITTVAALFVASVLTYGIERPALKAIRRRHDAWRRRRDSLH